MGHLPSFFVPTVGHLAAQASHPPGICHPRQKNANTWWSSLRGGAQLDLNDARNGELVAHCCGFHCCERWLHHHNKGSVNSKCTHTPKSIRQVLKHTLTLQLRARANNISKLNKHNVLV